MRPKHPGSLFALAAVALSQALASPALASLGGSAGSVDADASALKSQLRSTPLVQYDMQEIASGALVVREYVTRSGQVFALTWQGPVPPNLQQLLGVYFARLQNAAVAAHEANPGIHRQLSISQPDLVVQSSGRLRSFHGFAYLPALVPAGVVVSELQ